MAYINNIPYEVEKKRNFELTDTDIEILREWMKKQPHLPQMSDSEIALFLHVNYYRVESTKNTIETYCTLRSHVPEFFGQRDPLAEDFQQIIQCVANMPLKKLTKDGYHVLYSCFLNNDTSGYDFPTNVKLATMMGDLNIRDHGTCKGHVLVIETKGLAMGHLTGATPTFLKKFVTYVQDGAPLRLKAIHFLHINPVVDIGLNMVKPFLKKELLDVIHFHKSVKTIEKFMDLDILPDKSGGTGGKIEDLFKEMVKKAEANRQWFLDLEKAKQVDESKRIGPAKNAGELFGVEGSFKKLDID